MIPFEEIDERLAAIGKNRAWLADVTGRSPNSIRAALAPNAKQKDRSKLLQRALTEAIEREEKSRRMATLDGQPNRIAVNFTDEELDLIMDVAQTLGTPYREYIARATVARARQDAANRRAGKAG